MSYLLVNADDFGLHHSINVAISSCVTFGTVNSISVVTNGPAFDSTILKTCAEKGVFVGIHLTWVGEPWLTQDLIIKDWKTLLYYLFRDGKTFRTKLLKEAEAQILTLSQTGICIDHIDSHQHVHHLPILWGITRSLQQKYHIQRMRNSAVKSIHLMKHNVSGIVLNTLAQRNRAKEDYFVIGIRAAGKNNQHKFALELKHASGFNTELIVHPGLSNESLNLRYADWNFDWEMEYEFLMDIEFLNSINKSEFKLKKRISLGANNLNS